MQEQRIQFYRRFFREEHPQSFEILAGTGPVMISAPHSVSQLRQGSPKPAEPGTGLLAGLLHDELGCPVIFKTRNLGDDANFDQISPYREALCRYVREHGIRFLLDLHQLSPERKICVDIGTGHFANAGMREVNVLLRYLSGAGLGPIQIDGLFSGGGRHTVSSHAARVCGIACLQLELHSRLFPGESASLPARFSRLYRALCQAVGALSALPEDPDEGGRKD